MRMIRIISPVVILTVNLTFPKVSLGNVGKSTGSPVADDDWDETETAVNAFTLVHHDLNVCTNSAQGS